jgi:hypothetical protein
MATHEKTRLVRFTAWRSTQPSQRRFLTSEISHRFMARPQEKRRLPCAVFREIYRWSAAIRTISSTKFHLNRTILKVRIQIKSALFGNITQRPAVIPYRRLGTNCRSYLQGSVDFLTVEYGTDRMSRNVGREFTTLRCIISQTNTNRMYIAAKAWNHEQKLINSTVSWHDDGSNFSRNMHSSYSSSFSNKRNFLR